MVRDRADLVDVVLYHTRAGARVAGCVAGRRGVRVPALDLLDVERGIDHARELRADGIARERRRAAVPE